MAKLGDVIRIPFGDSIALGKIIYLSTFMPDVFGFKVLSPFLSSADTVEISDSPPMPITLPAGERMVLYADIKAVTSRKIWPVIGHIPVTPEDEALLLHAVGGTLYQGNEEVRTFQTIEERKLYPQILTGGDLAIVNILTYVQENS